MAAQRGSQAQATVVESALNRPMADKAAADKAAADKAMAEKAVAEKAAAEKAAGRLLYQQPNWLIIVEGVQSANDISGARLRPIELVVPNRLVYSAHVYGWSGWGSPPTLASCSGVAGTRSS